MLSSLDSAKIKMSKCNIEQISDNWSRLKDARVESEKEKNSLVKNFLNNNNNNNIFPLQYKNNYTADTDISVTWSQYWKYFD